MRVLSLLLLGAVILSGMQARAGVKCMPEVLAAAVHEFEAARQTGIVATGPDGQVVQLGSDLDINRISIRDDQKNSFSIFFELDFVNGRSVSQTLMTQVSVVNMQTCELESFRENPPYRLSRNRNP